jgi:hypothetical protein
MPFFWSNRMILFFIYALKIFFSLIFSLIFAIPIYIVIIYIYYNRYGFPTSENLFKFRESVDKQSFSKTCCGYLSIAIPLFIIFMFDHHYIDYAFKSIEIIFGIYFWIFIVVALLVAVISFYNSVLRYFRRSGRENLQSTGESRRKMGFILSDYICEKCGSPMFISSQETDIQLICSGHEECSGINTCNNKKSLTWDKGFRLPNGMARVGIIEGELADEVCKCCGKPMIEWKRYSPVPSEDIYIKYCSTIPICKNVSYNPLPVP